MIIILIFCHAELTKLERDETFSPELVDDSVGSYPTMAPFMYHGNFKVYEHQNVILL